MTPSKRITSQILLRYLWAGAMAGFLVGLLAAISLDFFDESLDDRAILWWTPIFYGLLFAPIGILFGVAINATESILRRHFAPDVSIACTFSATLLVGMLTELRWRVHADQSWLGEEFGWRVVDVGLMLGALAIAGLAFWLIRRTAPRLQWAFALACLLLAGLASSIPVEKSQVLEPLPISNASGPNVILIAIDTLRADHLGFYDQDAKTHTPSIDAFAEDSVLFSEAFAQGTWTKPSFGAIYTSLHPREHTAIDNEQRLPDAVTTLAEVLREGGYTTLGMSNCNPNNSLEMNFAQGFEYFEDLPKSGFRAGIPISGRRLALVKRFIAPIVDRLMPLRVQIDQYYQRADRIAAMGLDWLDTRTDPERPFFLMVHFMDPHDPYMNGARLGKGYTHHLLMSHAREEMVDAFRKAYVGDIDFMDSHVGSFLHGMRERGIYDDALIILTSDHGEEFLEHGDFSHGQSVYDELVRVPFLIKLPANLAAGSENPWIARHIDIAPTIISLADLDIPTMMRGSSLLAADGAFLNRNPRPVFSEANLKGRELIAVRAEGAKFIRDGSYGGERRVNELYDLESDAGETTNLFDSQPPELEALSRLVTTFLELDPSVSREDAEISPGLADQLEALGYID